MIETIILIAVFAAVIYTKDNKHQELIQKVENEEDPEIKKAYEKEQKKINRDRNFYIFLLCMMIFTLLMILASFTQ
jgi:Ca2+/H+ antiporter